LIRLYFAKVLQKTLSQISFSTLQTDFVSSLVLQKVLFLVHAMYCIVEDLFIEITGGKEK